MAQDPNRKSIIFYAEVLSTEDPMKLGRVQVKLNSLDKAVEMPWIRMIQAQASSKSKGTVILPEEKDIVAVAPTPVFQLSQDQTQHHHYLLL